MAYSMWTRSSGTAGSTPTPLRSRPAPGRRLGAAQPLGPAGAARGTSSTRRPRCRGRPHGRLTRACATVDLSCNHPAAVTIRRASFARDSGTAGRAMDSVRHEHYRMPQGRSTLAASFPRSSDAFAGLSYQNLLTPVLPRTPRIGLRRRPHSVQVWPLFLRPLIGPGRVSHLAGARHKSRRPGYARRDVGRWCVRGFLRWRQQC